MRKNDAGLTILEHHDIVRVGKGRVHWTVTEDSKDGYVSLVNPLTERLRFERMGNVTLVQNVRNMDEWSNTHPTSGSLAGKEPMFSEEETTTGVDRPEVKVLELTKIQEEPVEETSAYAKAVLFALNKLQKHVYAGTVRSNVKAKRRGLNSRQKASRKANR
jgi:hypothetical protein